MKCCLTAFLFSKIFVSELWMYFSCLDFKRALSRDLNRNQIKPQHLCLKKSLGKIMQYLNPSLLVAGLLDVRLMCLNFFSKIINNNSKMTQHGKTFLRVKKKKYKNFKAGKIIKIFLLSLYFSPLCHWCWSD